MYQTVTRSFCIKLLTVVLFATVNLTVFAQSNPTSFAQGFNIFVKNGATLQSSQLQGALAVGGDFTINGNYTIAASSAGSYIVGEATVGLLVGGKVNYTSGNQLNVNNGYLIIGNSTGSVAWYKDNNGASCNLRITKNGYGDQPYIQLPTTASHLGVSASNNPVFQSSPINFATAFTQLQASSNCMSTYATKATLTNPNGNVSGSTISSVLTNGQLKINLASGVNVLNVTGSDLNSPSNITFTNSPDANHVLVVNVNASGSYTWNVWSQSGVSQSNAAYVIYNFYNTTSLNISGNNQLEGTVFAPFADINKSSSSNIEGQIIGNSLIQVGGSINSANFNYNLPSCTCSNPVVSPITGTTSFCNGATTTLSDATIGGVWSSSNTSVATVSGGVVTGVSAGTATISYAVTNSCGTTTVTSLVTVNANPTVAAITGTANVCVGKTTQLADATSNGVWSSSNTVVATIASGLVTSVTAGTSTISYTVTNASSCYSTSTTNVTVNALPVLGTINGNSSVCVASTVLLTNSTTGGTWSSFNNYVGSINATSGVFTGNAYGTSSVTYTYTNANGCTNSISTVMSVNNNPYVGSIVGSTTLCTNNIDTLTPGASGGTWSASNSTVATISTMGYVTGIAAGSDTISYTLTNTYGCTSVATTIIKVSTNNIVLDTIVGNSNVCVGVSVQLSNSTSGGIWSSFNNYAGSISTIGLFTGNNYGSTAVTYLVSVGGCTAKTTKTFNVNNSSYIGSLTGANAVCVGSAITIKTSVGSGVWTTSNKSVATVSSIGIVTGVANGIDTVTYSLTNSAGCTAKLTQSISVAAIASTTNASICSGTKYTFNGVAYSTSGTYVAHVTNSAGCDSAATLNLTVINTVTPSVSVTASSSTICAGSTVNFTASALNSGSSPVFQWKKNDLNVGTNSTSYLDAALVNGDVVLCVATPNNTCQTANTVTSASDTIKVLALGTWSGTTNSDWSNTGNWCGGVVPTVSISAIIPSGVANTPTITGTSTVNNLTIAPNTTLKVTGTLQIAGAITNAGTVDASAGTITLNGTTAQTMPTNIFWNKKISNLIINNSNGVTLLDSLIVTGAINPVSGVLNTAGKLFLKSDSLGTARINQGNGNYINGLVTVERYISPKTARKYSFIGSPVIQTIRNSWQQQIYITGAGIGGTPCGNTTGDGGTTDKYNSNGFDKTATNSPSMFTYQATPVNGSRWVSIPNTDKTYLTPGIGYKVNIRGNRNSTSYNCNNQLNSYNPGAPEPVTLIATGTVVTGDVVVKLNDTTQQKYTLLANPYLSQISYTAFKAANPTINPKIWTYSPFGNNNYTTYSSGVIVNGAEGYDNTFGDNIAEGQAFFVEANQNGNVVFQESQKTTGAIPNAKYFGTSVQKMLRVGLKTVTDAPLDEVVALFNSLGSKAVTANDAVSFNGGAQVLTILKGATSLAIATLPDAIISDTVSLGVTSSTIGTFRFDFSNYSGIDSTVSITLKDNFLNTTQDLRRNQTYYFNVTANKNSVGTSRFEVILAKGSKTLPVNFTNVSVAENKEGVAVKWQVAQESNISNYEVERSVDGSTFENVVSVKATGSSNYAAEDNNLPTSVVALYYRIKSVGEDGTIIYSATTKLTTNNSQLTTVSIYPNPVQSQLNITVNNSISKNFTVNLFTVQGKQLTSKGNIATENGAMHIDASTLSSGMYIVELTDEKGNVLKEKFVKQ